MNENTNPDLCATPLMMLKMLFFAVFYVIRKHTKKENSPYLCENQNSMYPGAVKLHLYFSLYLDLHAGTNYGNQNFSGKYEWIVIRASYFP